MRKSQILPAKKWMLVISCIGVLGLVAFSGYILFEATKAQVEVMDNGETQTVQTHANTVAQLLDELDITVGEHDDISPDMDAAIEDEMKVNHKTAKEVTVSINKDEETYYTTVDTIGEFLEKENIEAGKHDDVSVDPSDDISDGLEIEIDRAFQVMINDGGDKSKVWTTGATIEQLLSNHDISLKDADKVKPALDEQAEKDTAIKIVRVDTDTDKVEESVAFDTITEEDDSLKKGEEKVISEGKKGTKVMKYEITMENGEEVDRELVDEEVTKESKDRVVAIGTKEPEPEPKSEPEKSESDLVTLSDDKKDDQHDEKSDNKTDNSDESSSDNNEEPSSDSGEVLYMMATGYTADCSGCSGVTSTGIDLNNNPNAKVVAVDPSVIPLGSKVWVEGYGEAIAGDTGGAIKGNRIDIHVPDKADADKYNGKDVKVKILD